MERQSNLFQVGLVNELIWLVKTHSWKM